MNQAGRDEGCPLASAVMRSVELRMLGDWCLAAGSAIALATPSAQMQPPRSAAAVPGRRRPTSIGQPAYAVPVTSPWEATSSGSRRSRAQQGRARGDHPGGDSRLADQLAGDGARPCPAADELQRLRPRHSALPRPAHHHFADQPRPVALLGALAQPVADPVALRRRSGGDHRHLRQGNQLRLGDRRVRPARGAGDAGL